MLSFPVTDNLVLTSYYRPPFTKASVRDDQAIGDWAREAIKTYDIRTPSEKVTASTLSGGNQQKAVIAPSSVATSRSSSSTNRPVGWMSAASSSSPADHPAA